MKLEVRANSKSMTVEDVLYLILSGIVSAWDAMLKKFSVKKRLAKFHRTMCFVLALEISFGILLASIILCKNDIVFLRLGIIASTLLAIYSCKRLYPKI